MPRDFRLEHRSSPQKSGKELTNETFYKQFAQTNRFGNYSVAFSGYIGFVSGRLLASKWGRN